MSAYQEKAPEGTTHKFSEPTTNPWRDLSGPTWKWWSDGDVWIDSNSSTSDLIKRQGHRLTAIVHPAWTGEGLPPSETVCEYRRSYGRDDRWHTATILCVGQKRIFFRDHDGDELSRTHSEVTFRPIRTAEQIEADEREQDAQALFELINPEGKWHKFDNHGKDRYRAAVDAGYRKQVAT